MTIFYKTISHTCFSLKDNRITALHLVNFILIVSKVICGESLLIAAKYFSHIECIVLTFILLTQKNIYITHR